MVLPVQARQARTAIAKIDRIVAYLWQKTLDARYEFIGDEGFDQIVGGPQFERAHDILFAAQGCQHDHGQAGCDRIDLQAPQHLKSVRDRHHGIQHDDVREVQTAHLEGFPTVTGRDHDIASRREFVDQELAKERVVISDKNAGCRHTNSFGLTCSKSDLNWCRDMLNKTFPFWALSALSLYNRQIWRVFCPDLSLQGPTIPARGPLAVFRVQSSNREVVTFNTRAPRRPPDPGAGAPHQGSGFRIQLHNRIQGWMLQGSSRSRP